MAWTYIGDQLTNTDFMSLPAEPFHGDSPFTMWRINENVNGGMPFLPLMIGLPALARDGAFKDAAELRKVTVPQSCAIIGTYAFDGTQLRKVKISADCTYEETSFPEGCEIEFYGGGGDWGQLLDADDFSVIDSDGARIYVKG